MSLGMGECDAWAEGVLGEDLFTQVSRTGTPSGPAPSGRTVLGRERLTTVCYRIFLNEDVQPMKNRRQWRIIFTAG